MYFLINIIYIIFMMYHLYLFIFVSLHFVNIYILEELWKVLHTLSNQYYSIVKIWDIIYPVVIIRHPDDLEVKKYKKNIILFLLIHK